MFYSYREFRLGDRDCIQLVEFPEAIAVKRTPAELDPQKLLSDTLDYYLQCGRPFPLPVAEYTGTDMPVYVSTLTVGIIYLLNNLYLNKISPQDFLIGEYQKGGTRSMFNFSFRDEQLTSDLLDRFLISRGLMITPMLRVVEETANTNSDEPLTTAPTTTNELDPEPAMEQIHVPYSIRLWMWLTKR